MSENVKIVGKAALVTVNAKIYSLAVVRASAYSMLDEAYFFLDGDGAKITVELRSKADTDAAGLADKFLDRLMNYAVYADQAAENRKLRETILTTALLSAQQQPAQAPSNPAFLDDPLGIAKPWTPNE